MITPTLKSYFIAFGIFLILLLAAYLPFINHTGYLQDDWDTLFVTEQRGAGSLVDHFSIDRPLRGYFSLAEYRLLPTQIPRFTHGQKKVFSLILKPVRRLARCFLRTTLK